MTILTYNSWFQVDKDGAWNVLASSRLAKKGVERVVSSANGLIGGHLSVRLDAMLQTVELPTGIANLHTGLSHVDGDTLTL